MTSDQSPTSWAAVVLAGGSSARLGTDKTRLQVGGIPVLDRVLTTVRRVWTPRAVAVPVVCVGEPRRTAVGVTWVREEPAGSGPAAGLVAALSELSRTDPVEVVIVLAGDLPLLGARVLSRLLASVPPPAVGDGARLVDADGRPQHLLGAYRADALRRSIARRPEWTDASMRDLLAPLRLVDVPVVGDETLDVDTHDDLAAARQLAPGGSMPTHDLLDAWVRRLATDLALDPDAAADDIGLILDVARDAAHGVTRPAAPVTTFLLGVALGRSAGATDLPALAARVDALLAGPGPGLGPRPGSAPPVGED